MANGDIQTFNQIPTAVILDHDLTDLDKLLYSEVFTMISTAGEFFASNGYLAERFGKSKRSISGSISHLVELGYLNIQIVQNDKKEIVRRTLTLTKKISIPMEENFHTPTQNTSIPIEENCADNISINKSINNTSASNDPRDAQPKKKKSGPTEQERSDFEKLWKLYPNKKGKEAALKSYVKAIRSDVTNKQIQDGIVMYKREIAYKGTEPAYIKHGSTWFNQAGWEDEYEVGSNSNTQTVVDHTRQIEELNRQLQSSDISEVQRQAIKRRIERFEKEVI